MARIGEVIIDVVLSETHDRTATVTEHPVEKSAPVSDHIRPMPQPLQITGILKDDSSNTAQSKLERLWKYLADGEVVSAETARHAYTNMAIVALPVTHDKGTGRNTIYFGCSLKQIVQVTSGTYTIKRVATPKAKPKVATGQQVTPEVKPKSSILYDPVTNVLKYLKGF